jgi:hypothetical protein
MAYRVSLVGRDSRPLPRYSRSKRAWLSRVGKTPFGFILRQFISFIKLYGEPRQISRVRLLSHDMRMVEPDGSFRHIELGNVHGYPSDQLHLSSRPIHLMQ